MIKSYQPLEDPFPLRRRHAWTGIPDFCNGELIVLTDHDMDLAVRPGGAHGVVDHVAQNAADFGRIRSGDDLGSTHGHGRLGMQQPCPIDLAVYQRPQRHRSKIKIDSGIESCSSEQIRNECAGTLGLSYQ